MRDGASFVPCSVNVKNFDRFFQCRLFESEWSGEVLIDKFAFWAWVYQGFVVDFRYSVCSMFIDKGHWDLEKFIIYWAVYGRTSAENIQGRRDCRRLSSPQIKSRSAGPFSASSFSAKSNISFRSSMVRAWIILLISHGPGFLIVSCTFLWLLFRGTNPRLSFRCGGEGAQLKFRLLKFP